MKQTILSKCFSKMKRVALTLFAALCVGSVWAAEPGRKTIISGGEKVFGLGDNHDEVAVVFKKTGADYSYNIVRDIQNIQFLAVGGGGGGGGAVSSSSRKSPGAGGGGGGVVTGYITSIQDGTTLKVRVGAGGTRGASGSEKGTAAGKGGDSWFGLSTTDRYITAGGGGAGSSWDNHAGKGASNAGNRCEANSEETKNLDEAKKGSVGDNAPVEDVVFMGSVGGKSYGTDDLSKQAAGGGGGATEAGADATEAGAGKGGVGYTSLITGESKVYGSGGGGGAYSVAAGAGGSGAGSGGKTAAGSAGTDNQGGGGGGGGVKNNTTRYNGGAGGSGIVVLRYQFQNIDNIVFEDEFVAEISKYYWYNAQNQTVLPANLLSSEKYVVTGVTAAKEIGTYGFTVTLKEGYWWDDETQASKEFTWTIHTINPSHGYIKEIGTEVVVVFTNHTAAVTWTPKTSLKNVQFLVVGGGGGGGGANRIDDVAVSPGSGGGGGGVVAGCITELKVDEAVNVKIGRGGTAGVGAKGKKSGNGKVSTVAQDSWFGVGELIYVTACKGGSDKGYDALQEEGASVAGLRYEVSTKTEKKEGGILGYGAPLKDVFISSGGASGAAAGEDTVNGSGGGGGAMGDGGDATSTNGGKGGAGYKSSITGTELDYGSGGGGGGGGGIKGGEAGGTGAGAGANSGKVGSSAKANRGGGGGGGGAKLSTEGAYDGGAGGSGIVVFRYSKINAVAKIGDNQYETLKEAIDKADEDDVIQLVDNIATDAAFEITKKVTIDLNGNTIATTQADTEGCGVFWVKTGGELTLNGEGTINGVGGNIYNIAIWADGGKVTINGGTYTNEGAQDDGPDGAHFDLIYVKNGGSVEINGGTFKCETPNWTLNSHDTKKGTIVVKGGTFYQFNPANCATEGAGTNFCTANYRAEADGEWYVVKEGYTITVEKPVVTVQTEAAANAVTLNVVAPENLTADEKAAYLGYFEKKITPEGSGFKVELALKDEFKPVIAETTPAITFEDGKVTVNIENELPGLYYGVRYATTVEAVDAAEIVPGLTVTPAEGDTAGFFKVVVDFKEIK